MNLPDLKKLNKIIALCRKQGVETIEIDGIKLTLREKVLSPKSIVTKSTENVTKQEFKSEDQVFGDSWDELSEEDRLLWSSGSIEG